MLPVVRKLQPGMGQGTLHGFNVQGMTMMCGRARRVKSTSPILPFLDTPLLYTLRL
jgi:hypothetical protein